MSNPVKPQAPMTKNGQPFYPLTTIDQVLDSGGNRLSVDSTIQVYTHTKTNNVHNFVGTGANGKAKITADFENGDVFAVNGVVVAAYAGISSPDKNTIINGRWVNFTFDGAQLNFYAGGGGASGGISIDSIIQMYTHVKTGTVHNFIGSGANGRAKITADFVDGDTFQVNGTDVAAYCGNDAPDSDVIATGRWVTFIVDGGTINFKGGGGLSSSKLALATATESVILDGYTCYAGDKTLKTGNIASKGTESVTLNPGNTYTFATGGKYCTGNMIVSTKTPSGSLTRQFDTQHDNWTDNRKSRARLNINVSVSGNTVRVYGYVESWIEGGAGGGDYSQNYDYTFYTY